MSNYTAPHGLLLAKTDGRDGYDFEQYLLSGSYTSQNFSCQVLEIGSYPAHNGVGKPIEYATLMYPSPTGWIQMTLEPQAMNALCHLWMNRHHEEAIEETVKENTHA